jgi:hypothetical protein
MAFIILLHNLIDLLPEVLLNVPDGFGIPSPHLMAQVPQPEGSMGG